MHPLPKVVCSAELLVSVALLLRIACAAVAATNLIEECPPIDQASDMNSYLWQIDTVPPSYLFGTIHVPYTQVWDYIPRNSKKAFDQATNVFFELDMTDHETVTALSQCQFLPYNQNLKEYLPKTAYRRIRRHMNKVKQMFKQELASLVQDGGSDTVLRQTLEQQFRSIISTWQRMRPVWLMLTLSSIAQSDLQSLAIPVLDLHLARQAVSLGKTTGAIEKVSEQCQPLNNMNHTQVMYLLEGVMEQHRKAIEQGQSSQTDQLTLQYNCGTIDASLISYGSTQLSAKTNDGRVSAEYNQTAGKQGHTTPTTTQSHSRPIEEQQMISTIERYFREEFQEKRNMRMVRRIRQLLQSFPNEGFFFAVGAGHFIGAGSIVDLLNESGYQVRHVIAGEDLPKPRYNKLRHGKQRKERHHRGNCSTGMCSKEYPNFTKLWNRMPSTSTPVTRVSIKDTAIQQSSRGSVVHLYMYRIYISFAVLLWFTSSLTCTCT